jgi:hypothetical protein
MGLFTHALRDRLDQYYAQPGTDSWERGEVEPMKTTAKKTWASSQIFPSTIDRISPISYIAAQDDFDRTFKKAWS